MNVEYIREQFVKCLHDEDFVIDKSGVKTIELINAVFHANEDSIFGNVNKEYVERELQWYKSMSLSVNDIPGGTPQIWKQVASKDGMINSNYGWCIYSEDNGYQFKNVLEELVSNPFSRRANMIYTRPSMHTDFNKDGMSDFICTNNVQYFIREGQLHACVFMRSNDAVFGYKNEKLPVFRNSTLFMKPDTNSYNNPIKYTNNPLLSGYISDKNLLELKNTSMCKIGTLEKGKVIYFTDNTNFRAFWYGTNKLLMNAIFFGNEM